MILAVFYSLYRCLTTDCEVFHIGDRSTQYFDTIFQNNMVKYAKKWWKKLKIHEKHEKTENGAAAKWVFGHLSDLGSRRDKKKSKRTFKLKKKICLVEKLDFRFLRLKFMIFIVKSWKSLKIHENWWKIVKKLGYGCNFSDFQYFSMIPAVCDRLYRWLLTDCDIFQLWEMVTRVFEWFRASVGEKLVLVKNTFSSKISVTITFLLPNIPKIEYNLSLKILDFSWQFRAISFFFHRVMTPKSWWFVGGRALTPTDRKYQLQSLSSDQIFQKSTVILSQNF